MSLRRVAVANLKGGIGKTTTAVMLACVAAAYDEQRPTILDLDPTGAATRWAAHAVTGGHRFPAHVVAVTARTPGLLARKVREAVETAPGRIFIDTPPLDVPIIEAGIMASDLIVVPTRESGLDAFQLQPTFDLAAAHEVEATAVLVDQNRRTRAHRSAYDGLRASSWPTARTVIPTATALRTVAGSVPAAALRYYEPLWHELVNDKETWNG